MDKSKDKVLFVTQYIEKNCGIGFIGELIGETLVNSTEYDIIVCACEDVQKFLKFMAEYKPVSVIYNLCPPSSQWINISAFQNEWPHVAHLLLHHDINNTITQRNDAMGFDAVVFHDPTVKENSRMYPLRRLIPPYEPLPYIESDRPIIGFQGFGAIHKGIGRLTQQVINEFDEAIINLQIPSAHYGSSLGEAHSRVEESRQLIKSSGKRHIELRASHDLLSPQELVKFMSKNTINCYFYDFLNGAGLASSPDYALAAQRPIAITKSFQFRNFWDIPEVFIENNSLKEIISSGISHLKLLYKEGSPINIIEDYEKAINKSIKLKNV
jgi:hypothetical protein